MHPAGNSGNITKALQAIAKFEELVRAGLVAIDFSQKSLIVNKDVLPTNEESRMEWYREAFLYFKFKAIDDFDEYKDSLSVIDKETKDQITSLTQDELLNSKVETDHQTI